MTTIFSPHPMSPRAGKLLLAALLGLGLRGCAAGLDVGSSHLMDSICGRSRFCMSLKGGIGLLVPEELRSGTRNPKKDELSSRFDAKETAPKKDGVYLDSPLARMLGLKAEDLGTSGAASQGANGPQDKPNVDAEVSSDAGRKATETAGQGVKEDAVRKKEAETKAKQQAAEQAALEMKAKQEAEKKAKEEAARKAEEEKKAKEAAEKKAQEEAARQKAEAQKAKEEAARKAAEEKQAKQDADKKAKEDAATAKKAKEEAEKKAKAEAAKKQQEEKQAKVEAEKKAKEEAAKKKAEEKKAQEEAAMKAKEAAAQQKEEAKKAKEAAEQKAKAEAAEKKEEEKKAKEEAQKQKEQEAAAAKKAAEAKKEVEAKKEAEAKKEVEAKKAKEEEAKKANEQAEKAKAEQKKAAEEKNKKEAAAQKLKEEEEKKRRAAELLAKAAQEKSKAAAGFRPVEPKTAKAQAAQGSKDSAAPPSTSQFPTQAAAKTSKLRTPTGMPSVSASKPADEAFKQGVDAVAQLASQTPMAAGKAAEAAGGRGESSGTGLASVGAGGAMFDELERELHGMERDLQKAEGGEEELRLGGRGARVNRCIQFLMQLPKDIRGALEELKAKDEKIKTIQAEYRKQLMALRLKFNKQLAPVMQERRKIVMGGDKAGADAAPSAPIKLRGGPDTWMMAHLPRLEGCRGVPDFWVTAMSRSAAVAWRMTARDIPVLRSLCDVRCVEFEGTPPVPGTPARSGFRIEFEFAPNKFLNTNTLTKEYWLNEDDSDVLELPVGCDMSWEPGCNPGQIGSHSVASFFDLFKHTEPAPLEGEASPRQLQKREMQLEDDFDVGLAFRHDLVPAALRWYTGEIPPDADDEQWDDFDFDDEE